MERERVIWSHRQSPGRPVHGRPVLCAGAAVVLWLAACGDPAAGGDPAEDPASDGGAAETSSPDPTTDSDGDGLTDVEELELGTDSLVTDSDGDGYLDYDEVIEGTDPLDADSRIYVGGWPYFREKDAIEDPAWDTQIEEGARFPRYVALDQYGDAVELYDFAYTGRPIVLDVGTWFCEPCKAMAEWFATGDTTAVEEYLWWDASYEPIRGMVERGEVHWITVLYSAGTPVTQEGHRGFKAGRRVRACI